MIEQNNSQQSCEKKVEKNVQYKAKYQVIKKSTKNIFIPKVRRPKWCWVSRLLVTYHNLCNWKSLDSGASEHFNLHY